jgi:hypothetical protein
MTREEVLQRARLQLAVLQLGANKSQECLAKVLLGESATTINDLNGSEILFRLPLLQDGLGVGYADVAAVPDFGTVLYSITRGIVWNEDEIRAKVGAAGLSNSGSFVAYNYPLVGLEVDHGLEGRRVYNWLSGEIEPIDGEGLEGRPAAGAYSLLEGLSPALRRVNILQYEVLIQALSTIVLEEADVLARPVQGTAVEIKYSKCEQSHRCFERRHQINSFWCVPASVEMLLAFYRYEYAQRDVASALGQQTSELGAIFLGPGNEFRVVEAISSLTRGALYPRMYSRVFWPVIMREIDLDRPLILFSGGHARVVTGYSVLNIGGAICRAIILFDPQDLEVCWEVFNSTSDLLLFSAALRQWVPRGGLTERPCADPP